jgi:hypothetical protein
MSISKVKTLLLSAALFAVGTTGCAVLSGKYVTEEPFRGEQVKQIRNYYTTKADILGWFGPPVAIARQGAVLKVPPPGPVKRGSREVPAEEFFKRFAENRVLTGDHIVYYYQDSSLHWADILFLYGVFPTTPSMRVTKFWVLINEKTGIVEDAVLGKEENERDVAGAGQEQKPKAAGTGTPGDLPIWKSGGAIP